MKTVIVDCTNFQEVDDGHRMHYGGEIVIKDLETGNKRTIHCSGSNDAIDCPGQDVLEYWPTHFGFNSDDLYEFELIDLFMDYGQRMDIVGKITKITAEPFDGDVEDENVVVEWIKSVKFEEQDKIDEFTLNELINILDHLRFRKQVEFQVLDVSRERLIKKIKKMIEIKS